MAESQENYIKQRLEGEKRFLDAQVDVDSIRLGKESESVSIINLDDDVCLSRAVSPTEVTQDLKSIIALGGGVLLGVVKAFDNQGNEVTYISLFSGSGDRAKRVGVLEPNGEPLVISRSTLSEISGLNDGAAENDLLSGVSESGGGHCEISLDGDGNITVTDLSSTNGTTIYKPSSDSPQDAYKNNNIGMWAPPSSETKALFDTQISDNDLGIFEARRLVGDTIHGVVDIGVGQETNRDGRTSESSTEARKKSEINMQKMLEGAKESPLRSRGDGIYLQRGGASIYEPLSSKNYKGRNGNTVKHDVMAVLDIGGLKLNIVKRQSDSNDERDNGYFVSIAQGGPSYKELPIAKFNGDSCEVDFNAFREAALNGGLGLSYSESRTKELLDQIKPAELVNKIIIEMPAYKAQQVIEVKIPAWTGDKYSRLYTRGPGTGTDPLHETSTADIPNSNANPVIGTVPVEYDNQQSMQPLSPETSTVVADGVVVSTDESGGQTGVGVNGTEGLIGGGVKIPTETTPTVADEKPVVVSSSGAEDRSGGNKEVKENPTSNEIFVRESILKAFNRIGDKTLGRIASEMEARGQQLTINDLRTKVMKGLSAEKLDMNPTELESFASKIRENGFNESSGGMWDTAESDRSPLGIITNEARKIVYEFIKELLGYD